VTQTASGPPPTYGALVLHAPSRPRTRTSAPAVGVVVAGALVVAAAAVPPLTGWDVHPLLVGGVAPLAASWHPRVGPGTVPALVLAALALRYARPLAAGVSFGRLLGLAYTAGLAWLVALATVDGRPGLAHVLDRPAEYLPTARSTPDLGYALRHYVDRIPHVWPTHIAGHPPGALLFFTWLVRAGLGGSLTTAIVVVLLAASTPLAVLVTLRRLGAEGAARRAAPFLVFGPAAIWTAVSADAMFAAVGAWGLAALAVAATSTRGSGFAALLGGLLLGYCAFLSYGLPLLAVPAAGVLVAAGNPKPSPRVLGGALAGVAAVVVAFAWAGFRWWDALPVVRARYYAGIASERQAAYWGWADLAALALSAGPIAAAGLAHALTRIRRWPAERAVLSLTLTSAAAIVLADLSFMSKAEVERIWLPFVPWLLVATASLPVRWRHRGLAVQIGVALVVQSLLHTRW